MKTSFCLVLVLIFFAGNAFSQFDKRPSIRRGKSKNIIQMSNMFGNTEKMTCNPETAEFTGKIVKFIMDENEISNIVLGIPPSRVIPINIDAEHIKLLGANSQVYLSSFLKKKVKIRVQQCSNCDVGVYIYADKIEVL